MSAPYHVANTRTRTEGNPFAGLPYVRKRAPPTTYEDSLKHSVETYKDMRMLLDWFFDIAEFQPSLPAITDGNDGVTARESNDENLEKKRALFQWAPADLFPPHLCTVPTDEETNSFQIFKFRRLYNTLQLIYPKLPNIDFFWFMAPPEKANMAYLFARNQLLHYTTRGNMYTAENIGLRPDWYTDAVFAQQQFIGVNPCTITSTPQDWLQVFTDAATGQGNKAAARLILDQKASFYIQDYSYYRSVAGLRPTEVIYSDFDGDGTGHQPRYGCASVVLYHLSNAGTLHPIAVILDYKGSIDPNVSITIFNRHLEPGASLEDQRFDWPWRYAKMCAQVADWTRHQVGVHLVQTHLLQEAIIVAAQRNLPDGHIVHELLSPHWTTTLSLNALARGSMVPKMVAPIAPFKLEEISKLAKDAYYSFDFLGSYVPKDLEKRGFEISQFDDPVGPYHNYAYGRSILKTWDVLHKFVGSVLGGYYHNGDADVLADKYVAAFCAEMQSVKGGQLPQFPAVKTLAELINMVTMCIHIAAPQHTAVNYLQQFYLTFVPNKPSALFEPLPTSLTELMAYQEDDILKALPLKSHVSWLMMAQIPYMLSAEVAPDNNIVTFAQTAADSENPLIAEAGKDLVDDVADLEGTFKEISDQMDDQATKYSVLDPAYMATSILI